MPAAAWGLLLTLSVLWGGSFLFIRIAVVDMPTLTVVLVRVGLAAAVLLAFARLTGVALPRDGRSWRDYLVQGILNNIVPFVLIVWGQKTIGAGLASILNATTPIWTVIIAHFATADEKLTGIKIAGTLTGLVGTILLFSPHITAKADAPLWALLLPVVAAISYGFAAIYARRFRGIAAPVTAAGQLTASTMLMLPVSLLVDRPWTLPWPPMDAVAAVLALAIISTALAYILYFRLIAMAGATNASLVTLLVPPSAILLGILLLGERLGWAEWAGMLVIGLGLVILDGRLVRRLAGRTA